MHRLEANFATTLAGRPFSPVWLRLRHVIQAAGIGTEECQCIVIKFAATCLSGARSAKRVLPHRRLNCVTQVCPERSAGTQTIGSCSFAFFACTSKKRRSPAGARPGLCHQHESWCLQQAQCRIFETPRAAETKKPRAIATGLYSESAELTQR